MENLPGRVGVETGERTVDTRAVRRRRVLKHGYVATLDEFVSASCIIHDQTEFGARVELEAPFVLSDRFYLHIELDKFKVICERVWQRGRVVGVKFAGAKEGSRLKRDQVVGTSEEALPDRFRTMTNDPDPIGEPVAQEAADDAGLPEAAGNGHVFGRRRVPPPVH